MIGAIGNPGSGGTIEVAGHSAAGPGSVGAVYHCLHGASPRTAAVFAAGAEEGIAEFEAHRLLSSI